MKLFLENESCYVLQKNQVFIGDNVLISVE